MFFISHGSLGEVDESQLRMFGAYQRRSPRGLKALQSNKSGLLLPLQSVLFYTHYWEADKGNDSDTLFSVVTGHSVHTLSKCVYTVSDFQFTKQAWRFVPVFDF